MKAVSVFTAVFPVRNGRRRNSPAHTNIRRESVHSASGRQALGRGVARPIGVGRGAVHCAIHRPGVRVAAREHEPYRPLFQIEFQPNLENLMRELLKMWGDSSRLTGTVMWALRVTNAADRDVVGPPALPRRPSLQGKREGFGAEMMSPGTWAPAARDFARQRRTFFTKDRFQYIR